MSDETPLESEAAGEPMQPSAGSQDVVPDVPTAPAQAPQPPPLAAFTKELRDGNLTQPMELTEFMFQLGFHLRLPGKRTPSVSAAAQIVRIVKTRWWIPAIALIAVVAVTGMQVRGESGVALAPWVLGEWQTTVPPYRSRGFTLAEDKVTLRFGEAAPPVTFPIVYVRRDSANDTVRYEVRYRQDRGLTKFEFWYVETPRPTIFLPNPLGVAWRRLSDSGYTESEATSPPAPRPQPVIPIAREP